MTRKDFNSKYGMEGFEGFVTFSVCKAWREGLSITGNSVVDASLTDYSGYLHDWKSKGKLENFLTKFNINPVLIKKAEEVINDLDGQGLPFFEVNFFFYEEEVVCLVKYGFNKKQEVEFF